MGTLINGKPLDPHGQVLMCAHLPFDSWRTRHTAIQNTTVAIINDCGVIADSEPYGLFSPLIPASATSPTGNLHTQRDRQACVPDILITFPTEHGPTSGQLAEIKSLSAGATWYQSNRKTVDVRAKGLPKLYLDKAKNIDRKYCGTPEDQEGPLEQRLKSFGELQCLVAGQYGEVSQHYHDLLAKLAKSKAAHFSQTHGRLLSNSEQGLLLHQLRRRLSVTIIRAQSSCLLSRLGHFQPGAREAPSHNKAKRRTAQSRPKGALSGTRPR